MPTESQKRANLKYNKANTKLFGIKVNKKTDADIYEKLSSTENVQGYLKGLIREDINKSK